MGSCVECGQESGPPSPLGGPRDIKYCGDKCRTVVKARRNKLRRQTDKCKIQESKSYQYRRSIVDQIKLTAGCSDCGYDIASCALDFDHINGSKKANVAHMTKNTWKRLYEEIMKCDVVCANCHRIRTNNRQERKW